MVQSFGRSAPCSTASHVPEVSLGSGFLAARHEPRQHVGGVRASGAWTVPTHPVTRGGSGGDGAGRVPLTLVLTLTWGLTPGAFLWALRWAPEGVDATRPRGVPGVLSSGAFLRVHEGPSGATRSYRPTTDVTGPVRPVMRGCHREGRPPLPLTPSRDRPSDRDGDGGP